jgi:hypothetical protein
MIPKEYLITDPSKLVKGQKLYSLMFGEVIFESLICDTIFCLKTFHRLKWSIKGKHKSNPYRQDLLLLSPFESQERVILVYDYITKKWVNRVLIKFTDNLAVCWDGAQTLESAKNKVSVSYWATWKELEPQEEIPEYTMEEIAVKLGHNFKIKK